MSKISPKKVTIEVEYQKKPRLTRAQLSDLQERMKCAIVLSIPERIEDEAIIVQNIFRDARGRMPRK
jgi:hypothetical protein